MNQSALFCFGSLMDWDVVSCVLNDSIEGLTMQTCSLNGFRVCKLPHEDYPVLVVDENCTAPGMLLNGLTPAQLDRILFYEGEEYAITPCNVELESGEFVNALFFDEANMPTPVMTDWCFDTWIKFHKDYLLRQCAAYMKFYGKMSAAEADYYWQTYSEVENEPLLAAAG